MITIGNGNDIDIGANPSAEDADEALDDGATTVNNIVHTFGLKETSFDKKSYLSYLKDYMKTIAAKLAETSPEAAEEFKAGAQAYAKKIVANFKDFEFFTGESLDPDAMVVLLNWREDGTTPYLVFWKHGLSETKV